MNHISSLLQNIKNAQTRVAKCDRHGEYVSYNYYGNIWTRCPECNREELRRLEVLEEEEERKRRRLAWELKIKKSGIPPRFQTRTLDTFDVQNSGQKEALTFAKDYATNFSQVLKTGRCAIFIGKPGTGKTHLAVGIGLHIMKENYTVLFSTVIRLIRKVRESWMRNSLETESQAVSIFTEPDLLILDEVGVQFGNEFEKNILFDILNERYEYFKPTILLSNLNKDELVGFLGERIIDRMREDNGKIIPFDWDSYRQTTSVNS